jgi:cytochrome c553
MAPPQHLSDTARAALRTQMRTHARGMMELVSTVTVLDYPGTVASVQRVLDEPRVARPVTRDASELNSALPERFFVLQDDLRRQLLELSAAAAARQAEPTARALGNTIQTCVRCHDAYLYGR